MVSFYFCSAFGASKRKIFQLFRIEYLACLLLLIGLLSLQKTAHSQCNPETLPFKENFDTAANGWTAGFGSSNFGDAINACWNRKPSTTARLFWGVRSGGTSTSFTGPANDHTTGSDNYIYTEASNISSGTDSAWIKTPEIAISKTGTPGLSFFYHMNGTTNDMGTLLVEITRDGGKTWIPLYQRSGPDQSSSSDPWERKILDLRLYKGDTVQVRFWHKGANSSRADLAIDDVSVSTCLSPSNLSTTYVGSDSAVLDWDPNLNQGSQWTVEWGVKGFNPGTGSTKTVSSTSVSITGLKGTEYDVYVTKQCGASSSDSTSIAFCSGAIPPYEETFADGSFPNCWSRSNSFDVRYKSSCGSRSDVLELEGSENAVTSEIDASDLQSLKVFYY